MAAVSAASAVGWVVSPIIRRMVSVVQSYISRQYSWKSEVMSDLKKLEATLMEILLVVDAAERRRLIDRNQAVLLNKMKDAVCDAEDVLDEFDYMLIKEKVERRDIVKGIAASSISLGKRLIGLDKFRSKLKKVLKSVAIVRGCAEMFVRVVAIESSNSMQSLEAVPARATGSLLHGDGVIGREKEVDELVGRLLQRPDEYSQNDEQMFNVEVHAIIGVGGIGKTTLAQLVYNDDRIESTFDLRIWVCVSNNFDKIRITKEIIACAEVGNNIKLTNLNFSMLQELLKNNLTLESFLLVLDDVWYEENFGEYMNRERWRELIAPIKSSTWISSDALKRKATGSKILVTSRTELAAKMLDSRSTFFLQGLGRDDSLSLFRQCAFGNRNPDDYLELEGIGNQIVQKLKGSCDIYSSLPKGLICNILQSQCSALALKVVGWHLNDKYTAAEWDEVLNENALATNDIFTILRLSYDSLPKHLQPCFAYCSLFPKDSRINPNRLIHMWIAQGFVHLEGNANRSLEDIGRGYFNDLLARSFFQVLRCGDQKHYVMHDLMSDLALHVSEGDCFRVDCDSLNEFPHSIRHLSISAEHLGKLVDCDYLRRLRSLVVLKKSWFCSEVCLSHGILDKLRSVRVLDVSGCCLEILPDAVSHLIHLRYLATQHTDYPLPTTISELHHLQSLFVQYHSCYSSGENVSSSRRKSAIRHHFNLPENINKLINLVHVDVEKAYALVLSGLHQLPCVEGSGEFLVDKKENSLAGLKDFNKLRGELAIRMLEHVKSREEAGKADLYLKEHVMKLELEWGSRDHAGDTSNGFEVLDSLKPHCNLVELTISGYPGSRSPSWLESGWLSRLELICLRDCKRWEVLPPLGDLPLLKALEVRRMEELKTLSQEFFGRKGFPSLERLLLERLPKLEWSLVENDGLFPALRHLSIAECPRLREYPTYLRTLRHIAILDSEKIHFKYFMDFELGRYMDNFELSRSFCCMLSSFFHVLHAYHLEFVEDLKIYVDYLVDIPKAAFMNMKSLKELEIYGFSSTDSYPIITTLWDENGVTVLPTSLQYLGLVGCHLQASTLSKLLKNLSCLHTLRLRDCDTVGMPYKLSLNLHQSRMLRWLYISDCGWLTSLEGSEALVYLKELSLIYCDDLESVPDIENMPSLQKLVLQGCPQVMRLDQSGCHTALKELVIESCDGLSSLKDLHNLVSLTKMKVRKCSGLISLPDMDTFYSLRILVIDQCPQLRSLPRGGLPVSLEAFFLLECHPSLEEQFQRKEGPEWSKAAAIPGCMCRYNKNNSECFGNS